MTHVAAKFLNIYGLAIIYQGQCERLASQLLRPFSTFLTDSASTITPSATIEIRYEKPPYETFPQLVARFSTPRNVVYANEDTKVIDYFGQGVVVELKHESRFTIYSTDNNFLQEAFYLMVLSLFGQHVDRIGMLRVHALSICYRDTAFLLPIPSGGGKSTMAISLLEEADIKLISDDEPLVDNECNIHPFHTRIGTLDQNIIESIPEEFYYQIDRMEFGKKYFIDCAFWGDKLQKAPVNKCILFVSRRILNGEPSIEPCSKIAALRTLVRDSVVGIGLYQGIEFIFKSSPWELLAKSFIVLRRFRLAVKLVLKSRTYQITLTQDIPRNTRVFSDFMRKIG